MWSISSFSPNSPFYALLWLGPKFFFSTQFTPYEFSLLSFNTVEIIPLLSSWPVSSWHPSPSFFVKSLAPSSPFPRNLVRLMPRRDSFVSGSHDVTPRTSIISLLFLSLRCSLLLSTIFMPTFRHLWFNFPQTDTTPIIFPASKD